MVLPSIFRSASARGLTLIEVLIVMGLLVILGGVSLVVSMDMYRGAGFYSERDLVVSVLQHARSLAVNNTCRGTGCTNGLPHGVHIQGDSYTLFQGPTYNVGDPTNAVYVANQAFAKSPSTLDIVFSQLSGTTTCGGCALTVTDNAGYTSVITVTADGQITWTK